MIRTRKTYTIEELLVGFNWVKDDKNGLFGLDGKLIIQPDFQRNYIYGTNGMGIALIKSILAGDMIGVVHFNQKSVGMFELLDGQQRITTIGRYVRGIFGVEHDGRKQYFNGLGEDLKHRILQYEIDAHIYEGTQSEIKRQFEKINIAGLALTEQEALNSFYSGPFVSAARAVFSNSSSTEQQVWRKYVRGNFKRQEILAVALKWVSDGEVDDYMANHQSDTDIVELKECFDAVIAWIENTFTDYYKEMRGIEWKRLYCEYSEKYYNSVETAEKVKELYADPYISRRGIFEYVLGGCKDTKLLNIRVFSPAQKRAQYKIQTDRAKLKGVSNCPLCAIGDNVNVTRTYELKEMEADHVTAWSNGGATDAANCEMLCITHNRSKHDR